MVALSFDDGPTPRGLEAVLPVLKQHGVKATFFVVGSAVEQKPELLARLQASGHEIGNHSWSHPRLVLKSPAFIEREVMGTDRLLRKHGVETILFRPPFFDRFYLLPRQLERSGYRMVTADVSDDTPTSLTPQAYAEDLLARAQPGSILLMHPMFGETPRQALPLVLDGLRRRGFQVVTVGELLRAGEAA